MKENNVKYAIISASYNVAYFKKRLIIKYHIGQPRDINPFDFSRFTLNVVSLLVADERQVVGKYNINSQGDLVLMLADLGKNPLEFIKNNLATIILIYVIIFGGKGLGFEIPSAIDKCKEWVKDLMCRRDSVRLNKAMADKAEAEVEKIRLESKQIEIQNEISKIELENKKANNIVDQIQESSNNLRIKPPSNNIIDIVDKLNK